jgi:hypothetical protein
MKLTQLLLGAVAGTIIVGHYYEIIRDNASQLTD